MIQKININKVVMEYRINNQNVIVEARKLTIVVSEDVEIEITQNQFGDLVITKSQYGSETGDLIISPNVSNQIRIK